MSDTPTGAPTGVARPDRRSGLAKPLQRLIPALTSAIVFGLLLGMTIVAFAPGRTGPGQLAAGAAAPAGKAGPFDIELGDLYVKPSSIDVPKGATVELRVHNAGKMDHSLELAGTGGKMLKPGESETVTWGPITSSVKAWCTVAGHKDAGMVLDILVEGSTANAGGATAGEGADDSAKIDFAAAPAPDWKPYDPAVAPAPGGTRHDVTFNVEEKEQEVAPGVTQLRWTFNGQVPGPTLRGKVGDLFTVTLVNNGTMAHSIDFHASKVAPNVEMRTIKPGEKLTYQFKADYAGIFYYHCGTDPMLHHIANGMYGALIVDPPNLGTVDREIILEQAELYLGPKGEPGDLKKMHAEKADAVVFNGFVNQYVHRPVTVGKGERVRVWVLNAGINEISSFHVIGTIFDTVYKEGNYLLRPDAGKGGGQALDLMPAQGGFVEFTLDRDGTYPFVTHKMSSAHKGAMGLFQVGAGQ
ncbi:multicopper oxidase domain-containing protein [Micromonospora citrea]|uniref:multicopper oxidase domain-containing protein n=1 Tax=Micromonospora citrea TaxID=47855 RepID=UPI003C515E32